MKSECKILTLCCISVLILFLGSSSALSQTSSGQVFDLGKLKKSESLVRCMEYLPDPQNRLDLETALTSKAWVPMTLPRLGYLDYPVWTRLRVVNSASQKRSGIFFNQRPMLNYMTVNILEQGRVKEKIALGFMVPPSNEESYITSHLSSFLLSLPPGAERTVISRLQSFGVMETGWDVTTVKEFSRKSRRNVLALGLNWGIMLALVLMSIIFWIVQRQPQFGLLVGYALFFTFMVLSLNGLPRIMSLGLSPWFWFIGSFFFPIASVLFWIPFTKFLLDTKRSMPKMHVWLSILQTVLALALVCYLAGSWLPFVFKLSALWIFCALIVCVTIILAGIVGVRKKLPHARMYLFGHALMFDTAIIMIILGQTSFVNEFSLSLLAYPWIVAAHVSVLGISLNMVNKQTRKELEAQRQAALEQSRFAAVGRIIGMVVHQWKTPLARLGTELSELELYFSRKQLLEDRKSFIRDELLPSINRNMKNMVAIVNDFSQFFSSSRHREKIHPQDLVNRAIEMAGGRMRSLEVELRIETPEQELELYASPSVLTHVLLVIIANTLDNFEDRNIRQPCLYIHFIKNKDMLTISIEDNGRGIDIKPIERIFDTFVSEKGKNHMGLGLNIARTLTREVLRGSIDVANTDIGARFCITVPWK